MVLAPIRVELVSSGDAQGGSLSQAEGFGAWAKGIEMRRDGEHREDIGGLCTICVQDVEKGVQY